MALECERKLKKMITPTVLRRLKRLESRFGPGRDSEQHVIKFVEADGTVTGSVVLHPGGTSTWTDFTDPSDQSGTDEMRGLAAVRLRPHCEHEAICAACRTRTSVRSTPLGQSTRALEGCVCLRRAPGGSACSWV